MADHTITLQSAMPVTYGCRIRIVYPPEYEIDTALNSMEGTGFLTPEGGTINFTPNYEENSVTFTACKTNYGQVMIGSVTLSKVNN